MSSCVSMNSAGVMILFGNSYNRIEKGIDAGGRLAFAVIESDIIKVRVANVYCPNDHVISNTLMESVYARLYEVMDRHEDAFLVLGGDFNACMSPGNSINVIWRAYLCRYLYRATGLLLVKCYDKK